jgi:hypothetical protein
MDCNYYNPGHYPVSCILFKTQLIFLGLSVPHRKHITSPLRLILSIGLWRWYINITITILDIIHSLAFYLKLNSTLYVCSYLTVNTLHLRYEPNRLMLSISLWLWYINNYNSGHYPSSCLLFITQLNSIGLSVPHRKHITSPLRLMLSIGLWGWYINITYKILDSIYRPVFYYEQNGSETGFYGRLQRERTHFGPVDRDRLCLIWLASFIAPNRVGRIYRRQPDPVSEMLCSKWKRKHG